MVPQRLPAELKPFQKEDYCLLPREEQSATEFCSRDLAFGAPGLRPQQHVAPAYATQVPLQNVQAAISGPDCKAARPALPIPMTQAGLDEEMPDTEAGSVPDEGMPTPSRPSTAQQTAGDKQLKSPGGSCGQDQGAAQQSSPSAGASAGQRLEPAPSQVPAEHAAERLTAASPAQQQLPSALSKGAAASDSHPHADLQSQSAARPPPSASTAGQVSQPRPAASAASSQQRACSHQRTSSDLAAAPGQQARPPLGCPPSATSSIPAKAASRPASNTDSRGLPAKSGTSAVPGAPAQPSTGPKSVGPSKSLISRTTGSLPGQLQGYGQGAPEAPEDTHSHKKRRLEGRPLLPLTSTRPAAQALAAPGSLRGLSLSQAPAQRLAASASHRDPSLPQPSAFRRMASPQKPASSASHRGPAPTQASAEKPAASGSHRGPSPVQSPPRPAAAVLPVSISPTQSPEAQQSPASSSAPRQPDLGSAAEQAGPSERPAAGRHSEAVPGPPAADGATEDVAQQDGEATCMPPFEPSDEDIQKAQSRLEEYRKAFKRLVAQGKSKPDMIANKELKVELGTPLDWQGHVPGVPIGTSFNDRGELAILGIHTKICAGIDCRGSKPANAICLSGGYKDTDEGHWMLYSGQGGKEKGRWVRDQTWRTAGNAALKLACQLRAPVRVVRAVPGKALGYTYDGLYNVHSATMEGNEEGFQETRFRMVGIPGHFKAGAKVVPKSLTQAKRIVRAPQLHLAPSDDQAGEAVESQARRTKAKKHRPGQKLLDYARGLERVKIPVYNEFNDELPRDDFIYVKDSEIGSEAAAQLHLRGKEAMDAAFTTTCGLGRSARDCVYNRQGHLTTVPLAVFECGPDCTSEACARNKVVGSGIKLPLEIFHTGTASEWGVRCPRSIAVGTFVACYSGSIIDERLADTLTAEEQDSYLCDLNNFVEEHSQREAGGGYPDFQVPPVPADLLRHYTEAGPEHCHCVIDARNVGNVARFFNHSCKPCLETLAVVLPGDNGLTFRVAMFASRTIAPLEELTWDYRWYTHGNQGARMQCCCGAATCRSLAGNQ